MGVRSSSDARERSSAVVRERELELDRHVHREARRPERRAAVSTEVSEGGHEHLRGAVQDRWLLQEVVGRGDVPGEVEEPDEAVEPVKGLCEAAYRVDGRQGSRVPTLNPR